MLSHGPAGRGRRRRRASGAWLIEPIHRAYCTGGGSASHLNHHLAPRSAMTLTRPDSTCCAHVQNKVHAMSQAQRSQPTSSTDRYRRALPHGKAFTGRSATLPPPRCTAVGLLPGPVTPEAAAAALGFQVTSHAYWRQSSSCCGRTGAALLRGRAYSGSNSTVPVTLYHPFIAADRRHGTLLGAHAERWQGGAWHLEARPCLPEPAGTTSWLVQCRFAAGKSAQRRGNTICAMGCYTPL